MMHRIRWGRPARIDDVGPRGADPTIISVVRTRTRLSQTLPLSAIFLLIAPLLNLKPKFVAPSALPDKSHNL
ncbi:hypothetical protein NL676_031355 [Syzygium grande]|nr:hypothetical protein NL676_031355 [Syzygium grande]